MFNLPNYRNLCITEIIHQLINCCAVNLMMALTCWVCRINHCQLSTKPVAQCSTKICSEIGTVRGWSITQAADQVTKPAGLGRRPAASASVPQAPRSAAAAPRPRPLWRRGRVHWGSSSSSNGSRALPLSVRINIHSLPVPGMDDGCSQSWLCDIIPSTLISPRQVRLGAGGARHAGHRRGTGGARAS